jgi:hypothetical protein
LAQPPIGFQLKTLRTFVMTPFKLKYSTINPFLLFILVSLLAVATHGVDMWAHFSYNLTPLQLQQGGGSDSGFAIYLNSASLGYYYTRYIVPWLEYGVVILTMAIIVRFLAYSFVYSICRECLGRGGGVATTFIFMIPVAYSAHGIVVNGLWGPPILFPATLSALFTLLGLLLFLRAKSFNGFDAFAEKKQTTRFFLMFKKKSVHYVLAGVAFGLSIQFHGLYGITAYAWLFIGSLMIVASRSWRDRGWFFIETLIVIGSISYIAYLSFENSSTASLSLTIEEWYRFINSIDKDDVSLLFSLEYSGYGLLPLIISGSYLAFRTKEKTDIEYLELGAFYTFLIFIIIEVFHHNGVFFGKISESFLGAQLRRGLWVPALLSLIVLAKNYQIVQDNLHKKYTILLVALGVTTCTIPSIMTVLLFFLVATYTHPKNQLFYILLVVVIGASSVNVYHGHFNMAIEVKSTILFVITIFTLYLLKRINRVSIRSVVSSVLIVIILAFFVAGLVKGNFSNSFDSFANNGLLKKSDHYLSMDNIDYYDAKAINCIKKNAENDKNDELGLKHKLQLPLIGFSSYSEFLYNQQIFHSPVSSGAWLYSKNKLETALYEISLLVSPSTYNHVFEANGFYVKKERFYDLLNKGYSSLAINQLEFAREKVGLRFYMIENKRDDLSHALLCVGDFFHVYDLKKL